MYRGYLGVYLKLENEMQKLIEDYYKDRLTIMRAKFKWLTPKEKSKMGKLPNRSEMSTTDAPADQYQGSDHKNKPSSDELADPGVNKIKKANKGKPPMSPVSQVMKAVTDLALNPKRKKATKKGPADNVKTDAEANKKSPASIYKNNGGKS